MNRDFTKIIVGIALLAFTGGSWWFSKLMTTTETGMAAPNERGVDYFIENFESTVMDQNGRPKYILKGVLLTHYRDDRPSQLKQPQLVQYIDGGNILTAAARGWLSKNGKELTMVDDVKILRNDNGDLAPSEITTDKITIWLDR